MRRESEWWLKTAIPALGDLYRYGKMCCMKKTLNIDEKLLQQAKEACGAATDTQTIQKGLEALVQHAASEQLRALLGSEPDAEDVPRRREKPGRRKRRAA
jgi:Arc/MetJ family transcription regulator